MNLTQRETDSQRQNLNVWLPKGEGGEAGHIKGLGKTEITIYGWIYTIHKQISNKDLLCSTGITPSILSYNGI